MYRVTVEHRAAFQVGTDRCRPRRLQSARAYTLVELVLTIALLGMLAYLVFPNLLGQFDVHKLPQSAQRMRGLLRMTRAQAMSDGLRYRIRFREVDELDDLDFEPGYRLQPVVEVERNPLSAPGEFEMVSDPWARITVFEESVRCARVRLGEYDPIEDEEFDETFQRAERDLDESELLPPLVFEPDGSAERATFVLTRESEDVSAEELRQIQEEDLTAVLEVSLDGGTGQVWIQRPFIEVEKELFRERRIRPELRIDWTSPNVLTEDNILELQLSVVRGSNDGS